MNKNFDKPHKLPPIKPRKKYETLNYQLLNQTNIDQLSQILLKQINADIFKEKYAGVEPILKMIGAGLLLAGSFVAPNLPKSFSPYYQADEYEAWKRFNIPYLKRTLERLERRELINTIEENGVKIVKITKAGKIKVLKYALDELEIKKPKNWDGKWWLISYDLPKGFEKERDILRDYLRAWGFYPLHKSVFLHAYPCYEQIKFLREYLGIGEYLRILRVSAIENSQLFKDFFGLNSA